MLVVPMFVLPNDKLPGTMLIPEAAPLPLSWTFNEAAGSVVTKLMLPTAFPEATGANRTVTVLLAWGGIISGVAKLLALKPLPTMDCDTRRLEPPELVKTIV